MADHLARPTRFGERATPRMLLLAFLLFGLAWLPLHFVSDSPVPWAAATRAHPEIVVTLSALNAAGLLALLAVLGGCLALVVSALAQALWRRDWRLLLLAVTPVGAALVASVATLLLAPAAHLFLAGGARGPVTPRAWDVRAALALGDAFAGAVGLVALGMISRRVRLGPHSQRVLSLAATMVAGALLIGAVGGVGTLALVVLAAQALGTWPPVEALTCALLIGAAALAWRARWGWPRSPRVA